MTVSTYPKYKMSNIGFLGDVPAPWRLERLKHCAEVFPSNVDKKSVEGQVLVKLCNYTDVYYNGTISGELDFMPATATREQVKRFELQQGDVVFTKDSESADDIGVAALVPRKVPGVIYGYHLSIARAKESVLGAFLKKYFDSEETKAYFAISANGLTRVGLGQYAVDNAPIALPSLGEQAQIVRFLDHETAKIDALTQEQKRLIELLKEKRQAVISHAVTKGLDPNVPMKDSGVEWLGKVPAHWSVLQLGKQIRLQRGVDITKDHQREGLVPVVSSGGISSYHDTAICEGPGVVVGRKGTAGKVHFVDCDYWPHDTTLYVSEFRGNHPRYVFYKLLSMELETYDTGSANPTLNRNVVHPQKVTWPPLVEQCQISDLLDQVSERMNELETQSLSSINLLKERRSALISAAVTGKIDVRNWQPPADESAFDAKIRMAGSESTV
jgi:type I restriction enzyme S subunit